MIPDWLQPILAIAQQVAVIGALGVGVVCICGSMNGWGGRL